VRRAEVEKNQILLMRSNGMLMKEISQELGVSIQTLYNRLGDYDKKSKSARGTCMAEVCNGPRATTKEDNRYCLRHQPTRICRSPDCWNQRIINNVCRSHYRLLQTKILDSYDGNLLAAAVDYDIPWTKRTKLKTGYVYLYFHGHKVREHRVVLSRKLGRALEPHESPHHKNGVEDDNRPENLELMVSHPRGQRPEDLLVFAQEIFDTYGDAA
jgi:hypothetical protein